MGSHEVVSTGWRVLSLESELHLTRIARILSPIYLLQHMHTGLPFAIKQRSHGAGSTPSIGEQSAAEIWHRGRAGPPNQCDIFSKFSSLVPRLIGFETRSGGLFPAARPEVRVKTAPSLYSLISTLVLFIHDFV